MNYLVYGWYVFILIFFWKTILYTVNFIISAPLSQLNHFDEVITFQNGAMGLNLHDVSVDVLILWKFILGYSVSHIDNAVVSVIGTIVKENVKGIVIGLVDQHELGIVLLAAFRFPVWLIILDGH